MRRRAPRRPADRLIELVVMAPLVVLFLVGLVLLSPLVLASGVRRLWQGWRLRRAWEEVHGREGRRVLFVYSESPHWRDYVESEILPRLEGRVVTVNWSRRKELDRAQPLEWRVYRRWSPAEAYNPLALVIPRRGRVRRVSFWQAFRDRKHGRTEALAAAEAELFRLAGEAGRR